MALKHSPKDCGIARLIVLSFLAGSAKIAVRARSEVSGKSSAQRKTSKSADPTSSVAGGGRYLKISVGRKIYGGLLPLTDRAGLTFPNGVGSAEDIKNLGTANFRQRTHKTHHTYQNRPLFPVSWSLVFLQPLESTKLDMAVKPLEVADERARMKRLQGDTAHRHNTLAQRSPP